MTPTQQLVYKLFKNSDGEPFVLTPSQDILFQTIFGALYSRVFICCYTQFGKSDTTSMAILARICAFPEKFAIVAPTNKKASIIMSFLIDHIFDNQITLNKFSISKEESLERIQRERNKSHLTFRHSEGIGEVMTLSAEGRRTKDILNQLLGFGAKKIVVDESPLLSEEHYAGVLRMLGGHKENFLYEIGNAISRNHFFKSSRDTNYKKIIIPYTEGIMEGRQKAEFFEEMKRKMRPDLFSMLYECKFPDAEAIDSEGYSPLLTEADLDRVLVDEVQLFGERRLSIDVAGGGRNKTVIVLAGENAAKVVFESDSEDTMGLVGTIIQFAERLHIEPQNIFIDKIGIGKGAYDRLVENGLKVSGIAFGAIPEERDNGGYGRYRDGDGFLNLRAQCYWRMSEKIKAGFQLKRHEKWNEILEIRYKIQSDKKVKIISKEELLHRGVQSPDYADALAMLFARRKKLSIQEELSDEDVQELTNVY